MKKVFIFVFQITKMATKTKVVPIPEQITQALDGRTQRWLVKELGMKEDTFSKKMRGFLSFTPDDIERINERLSVNIPVPEYS